MYYCQTEKMFSTFPERLKELRLEKGLSHMKLSEQAGVSSSSIGHWELGQRIPNLNDVVKLAQFFNVTVGYIAGVED